MGDVQGRTVNLLEGNTWLRYVEMLNFGMGIITLIHTHIDKTNKAPKPAGIQTISNHIFSSFSLATQRIHECFVPWSTPLVILSGYGL
jgi:hypothetical protein